MSTTHDQGDAPHQSVTDDGPRLNRDQIHDIDRLRRSSTDRYIAGVAGGLGRHFSIDPTIIRVVLAVACLFGGAGLILYVAVWLFVPEDNRAEAPIRVSGEVRRILLFGAAAIAVLALVGDSWGGYHVHFVWPLAVIAVVVALVAGSRRRPDPGASQVAEYQAAQAPAYQPPQAPDYGPPPAAPAGPPTPPTWVAPPPRPRRTGLVLFWPTLALIAVGLGVLGIYDIDHSVASSAWVAVPLAIIGAMLVLGAFVGRPGGLIFLGLLALPALAVTVAAGNVGHWESHTVHYAPASAAQVDDSYRITNGRMVLDLRRLEDPAALDGRRVNLRMNAGEIRVWLPRGVRTEVDASLGFAGDVEVGNRQQSGFGPEFRQSVLPANALSGDPTLSLDVQGHVGHIEIDRY